MVAGDSLAQLAELSQPFGEIPLDQLDLARAQI